MGRVFSKKSQANIKIFLLVFVVLVSLSFLLNLINSQEYNQSSTFMKYGLNYEETINGKIHTLKIGVSNILTDEGYKPFNEIYNITRNGRFIKIKGYDFNVTLDWGIIQKNGVWRDSQWILSNYPQVKTKLKPTMARNLLSWDFDLNTSQIPLVVKQNVDKFYFELESVEGNITWNDVSLEDKLVCETKDCSENFTFPIIKLKDTDLSFEKEYQKGLDIFINKSHIIYSNITNAVVNGMFTSDPEITISFANTQTDDGTGCDGAFGTDFEDLYFGDDGCNNDNGIRFINIPIPRNANIIESNVSFRASQSLSGSTVTVTVDGEATDSSETLSDLTNFNARIHTNSQVVWSNLPSWTDGTDYVTPDLKDVIQEIVNRSGWIYGNNLMIFVNESGASSAHRTAEAHSGGATPVNILTISYTVPTCAEGFCTLNGTAVLDDDDTVQAGTSTTLFVDDDDSGGADSFIKFDLTGIPSGSMITEAIACHHVASEQTESDDISAGYGIANWTWTEEIGASSSMIDNQGINYFNVTGITQDWLCFDFTEHVINNSNDGKENVTFGFRLFDGAGDAGDDFYEFRSKENAAEAFRPFMDIYHEPLPCSGGSCEFNGTWLKDDIYFVEAFGDDDGVGFQMKWFIGGYCSQGLDLTDATLRLWIGNVGGIMDTDSRVYYIRDQTWNESISVATLDAQTEYNTTGSTWSSIIDETASDIDVTVMVQEACNRGDNYMTIRIEDLDDLVGTIGSKVNNVFLKFGNAASRGARSLSFASRENETITKTPKLLINYATLDLVMSHLSPEDEIYNADDGLTTFICNSSGATFTGGTLELTKFYGGLAINRTYNISEMNLNGDELNLTVNLTTGWYNWRCNGTAEGSTDETGDWLYKTGHGKVLIHNAVHTEAQLNDTHIANLNNDISEQLDELAPVIGLNNLVYEVMNDTWRGEYYDSQGKNITFSWAYIMEEVYCESDSGCSAVIDAMQVYETNMTRYGDGEGWHYHSREWYNFSQWDDDGVGFAIITDTGTCPSGGCQDNPEYWNQILTMNDDYPFRDETSEELAEKMLAIFLIESNYYPINYVSGWLWENNEFSNWIEDYVPLSFNNWRLNSTTSDSNGEPIQGVQSWKDAPQVAYNPSSTDYKAIGDNKRIQFLVHAGHNYDLLNHSFWLASQGLTVVYAHYSHSYSSIKSDSENTHQCLNDTIWGACDEGTDMAELYPNVTYNYDDEIGMIQNFFELDDIIPPNFTLWVSGDWAFFNSTESLWNNPILAIQNSTSYYIEIGVENGTVDSPNQWKVNVSKYGSIQLLRAAGIDEAYNPGYSEFLGELIFLAPTTSNPYNVVYPANITINVSVKNITGFLISGVQYINTTIGGIEAPNISGISYLGSNIWQVNITIPDLEGLQDLYMEINHSDTKILSHTEMNSIDFGSGIYSIKPNIKVGIAGYFDVKGNYIRIIFLNGLVNFIFDRLSNFWVTLVDSLDFLISFNTWSGFFFRISQTLSFLGLFSKLFIGIRTPQQQVNIEDSSLPLLDSNRLIQDEIKFNLIVNRLIFGKRDISLEIDFNENIYREYFAKRSVYSKVRFISLIDRLRFIGRTTSNEIQFFPEISRTFFGYKTLQQKIGNILQISILRRVPISIWEDFSIKDSLNRILLVIRNPSNNIFINTFLDRTFFGLLDINQDIIIDEGIQRTLFVNRFLNQIIKIVPFADGTFMDVGVQNTRNINEIISFVGITDRLFLGIRTTSDNINIDESLDKKYGAKRLVSDMFNLDLIINRILLRNRLITNEIDLEGNIGVQKKVLRDSEQDINIDFGSDRFLLAKRVATQDLYFNFLVNRNVNISFVEIYRELLQTISFEGTISSFANFNVLANQNILIRILAEKGKAHFIVTITQIINIFDGGASIWRDITEYLYSFGGTGVPGESSGGSGSGGSGQSECFKIEQDKCIREYFWKNNCPIGYFDTLDDCEHYLNRDNKIPKDINKYLNYFGEKISPNNIQRGKIIFLSLIFLILFAKEIKYFITKIKLKNEF